MRDVIFIAGTAGRKSTIQTIQIFRCFLKRFRLRNQEKSLYQKNPPTGKSCGQSTKIPIHLIGRNFRGVVLCFQWSLLDSVSKSLDYLASDRDPIRRRWKFAKITLKIQSISRQCLRVFLASFCRKLYKIGVFLVHSYLKTPASLEVGGNFLYFMLLHLGSSLLAYHFVRNWLDLSPSMLRLLLLISKREV